MLQVTGTFTFPTTRIAQLFVASIGKLPYVQENNLIFEVTEAESNAGVAMVSTACYTAEDMQWIRTRIASYLVAWDDFKNEFEFMKENQI